MIDTDRPDTERNNHSTPRNGPAPQMHESSSVSGTPPPHLQNVQGLW